MCGDHLCRRIDMRLGFLMQLFRGAAKFSLEEYRVLLTCTPRGTSEELWRCAVRKRPKTGAVMLPVGHSQRLVLTSRDQLCLALFARPVLTDGSYGQRDSGSEISYENSIWLTVKSVSSSSRVEVRTTDASRSTAADTKTTSIRRLWLGHQESQARNHPNSQDAGG